MIVYLNKSKRKNKKWMIQIENRTIHFGAKGMSDYTIHQDSNRKQRYIQRHYSRENWTDPLTAGFWSRWLLWEKPSLKTAIRSIYKKFGIRVTR